HRPHCRTGSIARGRSCARGSRRGGHAMSLTPEQQELGRRNFMRVLAGTPAVAALAAAAALKGPVRGGPVRLGFIGVGGQGRTLLEQTDPQFAEIVAICDINPLQLAKADASLAETK